MPRTIYLHGFASGASSRKARFFRERFAAQGVSLETPDLSAGDFENLTVGGQLHVIDSLLRGEPATLIGSSLGGYVAALYASLHPEIDKVVLLAPAFRFAAHWRETLGREKIAEWKRTGLLPVYHYAEAGVRNLNYRFVEEAAQWEPEPSLSQPTYVFHGTRDTVVPIRFSEGYAERHPHVQLTRLDSDHELIDVLEQIYAVIRQITTSQSPEKKASR